MRKSLSRVIVWIFIVIISFLFISFKLTFRIIKIHQKEESPLVFKGAQYFHNETQPVVKLLLFAYMRGGSSFLGDVFLQNPQASYWFEPLDGFYQKYFVSQMSTKPLQLLYHRNASRRFISHNETKAIVEFHNSMFNCDFMRLPVYLLVDYQNHRSSQQFNKCNLSLKEIFKCQGHMKSCLVRDHTRNFVWNKGFLGRPMRQACFNQIWMKESANVDIISDNLENNVKEYLNCEQTQRNEFSKNCADEKINWCLGRDIRVTKDLRLPVETLEQHLVQIPDLKVIYYCRDPRAIIASRLDSSSSDISGLLTFSVWKEAEILCNKMFLDAQTTSSLSSKYPGRILMLKFEDLANNSVDIAEKIYEFIGRKIPAQVVHWLAKATSSQRDNGKFGTIRKNSSRIVDNWRAKLDGELIANITETCGQLLQYLDYEL